jgi:hypothetical protein
MTGKERFDWLGTIAELCVETFPIELTNASRPICRRYQDQLLIPLLKIPELKSETLGRCLNRIGGFLSEDGKQYPAAIISEKAYNLSVVLWGSNNANTTVAMSN